MKFAFRTDDATEARAALAILFSADSCFNVTTSTLTVEQLDGGGHFVEGDAALTGTPPLAAEFAVSALLAERLEGVKSKLAADRADIARRASARQEKNHG